MGMRTTEEKFPDVGKTLAVPDAKRTKQNANNILLKINHNVPKAKRMPVFRQLPYGSVSNYAPLCVDPDDQATQVEGIKKRLGADVGSFGEYLELSKFVDDVLARVPRLDAIMSPEEWLASTHYNDARKDELRRENDKLQSKGFGTLRKLGSISPFIKREAYPMKKHARWINAPNDKFKCVSGPAFKTMEKVLYDLDLFGLGHSPFIKHTPVQDRPALIEALKTKGTKFYGTDYTAFESHMTKQVMLAIECRIYSHMLSKFPELSKTICGVLTGERVGNTRSGVTFKSIARRMSGDNCTSLGNGLTNVFLWAFLCKQKKVSWDGYVEGDDGIFVTHGGVAPSAGDFKELGFNIKIVESNDPSDLSFCGLVLSNGSVLREPRKFLATFGWSGSFLFSKEFTQYQLLRAKALSALHETPNCPIVWAIAQRALILTEGYEARFVNDGYHNNSLSDCVVFSTAISGEIREKYAELYGVSPVQQILAEEKILGGASLDFLSELIPPTQDMCDYAHRYLERG